VKVRRSTPRVTGIPDVAEDLAGKHHIAFLEGAIPIEMRVVVHFSSRAEDIDDLAAKFVGADADDDSLGCAEDGGTAWREYVDAAVRSPSASRRAPGVRNLALAYACNRNHHLERSR